MDFYSDALLGCLELIMEDLDEVCALAEVIEDESDDFAAAQEILTRSRIAKGKVQVMKILAANKKPVPEIKPEKTKPAIRAEVQGVEDDNPDKPDDEEELDDAQHRNKGHTPRDRGFMA